MGAREVLQKHSAPMVLTIQTPAAQIGYERLQGALIRQISQVSWSAAQLVRSIRDCAAIHADDPPRNHLGPW